VFVLAGGNNSRAQARKRHWGGKPVSSGVADLPARKLLLRGGSISHAASKPIILLDSVHHKKLSKLQQKPKKYNSFHKEHIVGAKLLFLNDSTQQTKQISGIRRQSCIRFLAVFTVSLATIILMIASLVTWKDYCGRLTSVVAVNAKRAVQASRYTLSARKIADVIQP